MDNKRKHIRTPFEATVRVWHEGRVFSVKTSDVSYGGVFLVIDKAEVPEIGTEVMVQVQGMAEAAPIQRMRVVRLNADGIGLEFMEAEDSEQHAANG